jgi:Cytochrome P460
MIKKSSVLLISLIGTALVTTVALGGPAAKPHHKPQKKTTLPAQTRYLPECTPSGDLILPKNNIWREWVFVGDPLTPNALNGGKAGFPEYHNVYIESGSYEIYKKTGEFPDGTIMFKELQLTLPPAAFPDGSRTEPSGRGYFPGAFNGADVSVKDTKRYADTNGWGYFTFGHHEPKAPTAALQPKSQCAFCHIANATKDMVFTEFYRLLE